MALPETIRFSEDQVPFDSPAGVVSYHQALQHAEEGQGVKRGYSLRLPNREIARLQWLANYLDVPASTLARQLLSSAIVQGMDSLNLIEPSKDDILAEIEEIHQDLDTQQAES